MTYVIVTRDNAYQVATMQDVENDMLGVLSVWQNKEKILARYGSFYISAYADNPLIAFLRDKGFYIVG